MRQVGTCTLGPTVKAGLNHDGGAAAAGADGSLLHDARPPKVRLRNEDACDAKSTGQRWKLLLRRSICACVGGDEEEDDGQDAPSSTTGASSSAGHRGRAGGDRRHQDDDEEESHLSQTRTVRQYNLTKAGNAHGRQVGGKRTKGKIPLPGGAFAAA